MKIGRLSLPFRDLAFWSLCVLWVSLAFSKALIEISFVCALVFWLLDKIEKRSFAFPHLPKSLAIPLIAFVSLSVLSYFWSEYPRESFRGIFKVLKQVTLFLLVISLFCDQKHLRRFENVFIAAFCLILVDGFCQYWLGKDFLRGFPIEDSGAGRRVSAGFGVYGHLATYLISCLPYFAALGWLSFHQKKRLWKAVFYGVVFAAGLILLYLTRSRGAFVAMSAGLVFFLIVKRKFLFLFLLSCVLAGGFFLLPRGMVIHLDAEGKEQSLVERFYLWDRALHVIKAKPLTGTGINTYSAAHAKYDKTKNWRVRNYYAHNGYLQLAAETGLPCLFFFLVFLANYFRLSFRSIFLNPHFVGQKVQLGLVVGLVNFLILTSVDTILHNPAPVMILWFLLGVQGAYRNLSLMGKSS